LREVILRLPDEGNKIHADRVREHAKPAMFDSAVAAAGHAICRGNGIFYRAFKRGCEAVPYPGKASFKLMAHMELASLFAANFRDNRESDSQLIWCVDNICWFCRCERIARREGWGVIFSRVNERAQSSSN
jgi:hypothetical protein